MLCRVPALALLLVAASARAEIDYQVAVDPAQSRIEVSISAPATGQVAFQIPNWMPGAYSYGDFYNNVHDVKAYDGAGTYLAIAHPDKNTWTADPGSAGSVRLSYWIATNGQRRFMGRGGDSSFVQISGPATYMYVVGRKKEPCKISFSAPNGWPIVTGLDAAAEPNTYVAPTYDVLADNPVSTGNIIVDQYNLRGINHYIVLEGAAKDQVDRQKLLKDCRFVSAAETDFFGGAPYHKYVWHFSVFPAPDGAGGLEHLSSTQITLSSGVGHRAESVLAHEYFHLWNVKRVRPKVLGPFDYLTLPKTGALWWLEGVTDYYASLLPYRYGEWTRPEFYDAVVNNLNAVKRNPARLEVSPYQASYRVGDAANGRGNSNGYKISYYNLGWLCGLCLDTEIRVQSKGRHSLDDVERALFEECKNDKPGFEEDEIRNQCIRFGGPTLGDFYDKVVMSPGELPIAEQLAKMGVKLDETEEPFVDMGFTANPGPAGVRISAVQGPGDGKLEVGDFLTSINGTALVGQSPQDVQAALRHLADGATAGDAIELDITRNGSPMHVTVTPAQSTRKVRKIEDDPNAAPAQKALRDAWLKVKTPAAQ